MSDWEAVMWRTEADPRTRSSGALLEILDSEPDWDRLVSAHERVVQIVPRLRDRVVEPILPLVPPAWSPDKEFNLEHHLHRVRLAGPGDMRELLDFTERVLSRPFDRSRPPWEAVLVGGLEGGRAAYVLKVHHSITDGQGLVQLLDLGHSVTPEPSGRERVDPAYGACGGDGLTPASLLASRLLHRATSAPGRLLHQVGISSRLAGRTITDPVGVLTDTVRWARSFQRVLTPPTAERSLPPREGGSRYRLVVHEVPLAGLKAAGKTAGGSVNDAFLAALLGGFRIYHEHNGVCADRMPIALPVSLRSGDDPQGGNRFAGARFAAPVGEPDPRARIQAVREFVLNARNEPAIGVLDLLAPAISRLPQHLVVGLSAGLTATSDVQASNVAGLGRTAYMAGVRVTHTYLFGPRPGVAAMVVLLSYNGTCCLAINIDPDVIDDVELFKTCMRQGFDEVLDLNDPSTQQGEICRE
jgi:WS/DGAT/MGAT family acyltransferase